MYTLDFGATTYDRHVRVQPTTKHGQLTFFLQKCAGQWTQLFKILTPQLICTFRVIVRS